MRKLKKKKECFPFPILDVRYPITFLHSVFDDCSL